MRIEFAMRRMSLESMRDGGWILARVRRRAESVGLMR